jgi:uncharacterized protein
MSQAAFDDPGRSPVEPDGAPRIAVLDILRGVAILGILFLNINDMGRSFNAALFDVRRLGWSAGDQLAWWLREVLANGTARGLLEMLFGAGMMILTERIASRADEWVVLRRYYARNLILLAFGLVHLFILLWPGDILHTYGIAALIAFLFRQLPTPSLFWLGGSLAAFGLLTGGLGYVADTSNAAALERATVRRQLHQPATPDDRDAAAYDMAHRLARATMQGDLSERIRAEDKARTGTFRSWATQQWAFIGWTQQQGMELFFIWEATATMLIGAGLFRLGILQGLRPRSFYVAMTTIAYGIALPLRVLETYEETRFDMAPKIGPAIDELARLAMTLGHIGLINLLVTTALGTRMLRPFIAAGRTALSIYVAQTLICLWVLYPPFMLGLYGRMSWATLMLTAAAVNAGLLVGANLWVRWFRIAPVEWAWRSLIERRALRWRHDGRGAIA